MPCARLHVRARLHEWGLAALAQAAELVTSELVTNGVSAAACLPEPLVRLSLCPDLHKREAFIQVWDGNAQMPVPGQPRLDEEGGRGLHLVAAFSARWGACPCPVGKIVWAIVSG